MATALYTDKVRETGNRNTNSTTLQRQARRNK